MEKREWNKMDQKMDNYRTCVFAKTTTGMKMLCDDVPYGFILKTFSHFKKCIKYT